MIFKIREAASKDLSEIHRLINLQADNGKILKRTRKEIWKSLRSFYVAEAGGQVVGCCALEIYNRKLAEVRSLVVEAGHQGRGIASALIERCVEAARRKKVYEVLAITDRTAIFHRKGFTQQLQGQRALFLRP
jgi:amino-acid N-acetyltransferase